MTTNKRVLNRARAFTLIEILIVVAHGNYEALDLVLQGGFSTTLRKWDPWWLAFYYIQVAYKMGGVEPLVNADNYNAKSPAEIKDDQRLQLVMEAYPAKALEIAEHALKLARTTG